jgi:hypothetical protein
MIARNFSREQFRSMFCHMAGAVAAEPSSSYFPVRAFKTSLAPEIG